MAWIRCAIRTGASESRSRTDRQETRAWFGQLSIREMSARPARVVVRHVGVTLVLRMGTELDEGARRRPDAAAHYRAGGRHRANPGGRSPGHFAAARADALFLRSRRDWPLPLEEA